jgi:glucose-6-phosphate isomerase
MNYSKEQLWSRFQRFYFDFPSVQLALDLSRVGFPDGYFDSMQAPLRQAFSEMHSLEGGAIANPDEKRMVGHYWLRAPELAPSAELRDEIEATMAAVKAFASKVHTGSLPGAHGPFENLLLIGIGGSALGPQFVANALGHPCSDRLSVFFFDNTDPDGMDKVIAQLDNCLGRTLCVVVSKSGGTKETRNGMLEAEHAYKMKGLEFGRHAVAITQPGSALDQYAVAKQWLARFPMWDWVGGRTSELSAVGLLPAALQGLDIDGMVAGARACDALTRTPELRTNPAALLALVWNFCGNGKGDKNMVVLPYKDRLELFSKYLQQLIMESLGKELDRDNKRVHQGLTVLGNKGSTDQHAYVQQLRDGPNDFFVTFIEVLRDRQSGSILVEENVTSGDYLSGFFQGTRNALFESGRDSVTITINAVDAFHVGALIALFERTVGLYASIINVNAYHQPGVEAGKKAAGVVIDKQIAVIKFLQAHQGRGFSIPQIAEGAHAPQDAETIFKICQHLAANPDRGIFKQKGSSPFDDRFGAVCMS